jgi:hypothetical protein
MNERIRKLAKEAGYYLYDLTETHECKTVETDSTDEWITLEKFAELIVLECIDIADEYDGVGSTIVSRIREHFGVEDRAVPILSADEQALFAGITSSKLFTIAGAKKQFGVEE